MAFFAGMGLGAKNAVDQINRAKTDFVQEIRYTLNDVASWFKKEKKQDDGEQPAGAAETEQPE
ncbi:MAG: hypothetical protein OXR68_00125 [Alphaproteobacteria bacterium]|nr:hypothetical protein [Alphaproteobacteria bacterium]MDD9919017.1 hypothetical protein [Alphaproteobacteria bacterium]